MTYSLFVPTTKTYDVKIKYKTSTVGGKFQLSINRTNVGSIFDTFSTTPGYVTLDLGNVSITSGDVDFKFFNKGASSGSISYDLYIDYIQIT